MSCLKRAHDATFCHTSLLPLLLLLLLLEASELGRGRFEGRQAPSRCCGRLGAAHATHPSICITIIIIISSSSIITVIIIIIIITIITIIRRCAPHPPSAPTDPPSLADQPSSRLPTHPPSYVRRCTYLHMCLCVCHIRFRKLCILLNWLSGALVGVGCSDISLVTSGTCPGARPFG